MALTEKQALQLIEHYWSIGDLRGLLFAHQMKMYDAFYSTNAMKTVFHCSRRIGKSAVDLVLLMEKCLGMDGAICRFGSTTQDAVREIIIPLMDKLTASAPKHLKPYYHSSGRYLFPHRPNSQLVIAGIDLHVDRLRGPATHLAAIDEAGFIQYLRYVIADILMPQFLTTDGRLILSSSSPETPQHPFVDEIQNAKEAGSYVHMTIYDDSREEVRRKIPQFIKEVGGEHTTTWKREYLCELVVEEKSALCPEFSRPDVRAKVIKEVTRPDYLIAFTVIDLGYIDNAAAIFGYVDYRHAKRVILGELLLNRKNSAEIAAAIRAKENEIWGAPETRRHELRRYADGQPLTIADFNQVHGLAVTKCAEESVEAKANRVRLDCVEGRLAIHPQCTKLIREVHYGVWNKNHTSYAREIEGEFGHFDLFSALTYFCMNADVSENPFPVDYGYDLSRQFKSKASREVESDVADLMKSMFKL
jgi:hypothetical protein